jgi:WD40 repeat protein
MSNTPDNNSLAVQNTDVSSNIRGMQFSEPALADAAAASEPVDLRAARPAAAYELEDDELAEMEGDADPATGVATEESTMASSVRKSLTNESLEKALGDVALNELDKTGTTVQRNAKYTPINPFQGDIAELPDPDDDVFAGIELTDDQQKERASALVFEETNHTKVEHCAALGFNFDPAARGNGSVSVAHVDDEAVLFMSGRQLHVASINNASRHHILPRTARCIEVVCFTISSNGKYVAVSERMADAPHVTVYKLESGTKITSLNYKHLSRTQITGLHFASNNKFLATLTAPPKQRVILWQLQDVKVIGVRDDFAIPLPMNVEAPTLAAIVTSLSINPWLSFNLATAGTAGISLWKLDGKSISSEFHFSSANLTQGHDRSATVPAIVAHCWYDEEAVAALSDDGVIVAIEDNQVKQRLRLRFPPEHKGCPKFTHLAWASRGVVAGAADGTVLLADRTYADPIFVQVAVFRTYTGRLTPPSIRALSVSPGETNIVIALSNNSIAYVVMDDLNEAVDAAESRQALQLRSATAASNVDDISDIDETESPNRHDLFLDTSNTGELNATAVSPKHGAAKHDAPGHGVVIEDTALCRACPHISFHSAAVTSMSTCVQRPIVATTAMDATLRLFNYVSQTTILVKQLDDEVLSSALHPTGLFITLGFKFYTRVYALLENDAHLVEDINIKPCYELRYSNGGGRLACAVNNRVLIYDAQSFTFVGSLIGHLSPIKSIQFSLDDARMTTCDVGGCIFVWNSATLKREMNMESSQKNLMFQQVHLHHGTGLFAAVGSNRHARGNTFEGEFTIACSKPGNDEQLVYIRPGMILPKAQAMRKSHMTLLALTQTTKTLIVGTPTGRLLLYTFPLLKSSRPYAAVDAHNAEITFVQLSPDEKRLFVVSADNTMSIYNLLHMIDGKYVAAQPFQFSLFDAVRYQHVTDVDTLDRDAYALKRRVEDRRGENAALLTVIKRTREDEMKALTRRFETEIDGLRRRMDQITMTAQNTDKKMSDEAYRVERAHANAAEELEVLYNKRSREASAQIDRLEAEREELLAQYEAKISSKTNDFAVVRAKLEARCIERERALWHEVEAKKKMVRESVKRYDAMLCQSVVDFETEMTKAKVEHADTVRRNEDQALKAQTTAGYGDREADRLRRDMMDAQEALATKLGVHKQLLSSVTRRDKENSALKKELLVKQDAINVSEAAMQALKAQLSRLENLRFVLTHQYDELRKSYIPKDGEIRVLEGRLNEMEIDLQTVSFERNQLREQVRAIEERLDHYGKESTRLRVKASDSSRKCKVVVDELGRLLDQYADPKRLAKDLVATVAFAKKTMRTKENDDNPVAIAAGNREMESHHGFMQAQLTALQRREAEVKAGAHLTNVERIADNQAMVLEIQAMRAERRSLLTEVSGQETVLRDTCVGLHRLLEPPRTSSSPAAIMDRSSLGQSTVSSMTPAKVAKPRALLPPIGAPSPMVPGLGKAGSRKSASPSPAPAKKGRKKVYEHNQVEAMVAQLDEHAARMTSQKADVLTLRDMVQELLGAEERRLVTQLRSAGVADTPALSPVPAAVASPSSSPASPADSPDWTAQNEAVARQNAMTPAVAPVVSTLS